MAPAVVVGSPVAAVGSLAAADLPLGTVPFGKYSAVGSPAAADLPLGTVPLGKYSAVAAVGSPAGFPDTVLDSYKHPF